MPRGMVVEIEDVIRGVQIEMGCVAESMVLVLAPVLRANSLAPNGRVSNGPGNCVLPAIDVNLEVLGSSGQDSVGPVIWLLQGLTHSVVANEDVGT